MRSVVVVLPASMWAMIPMFRTRSSATAVCVAAIKSFCLLGLLPAVVSERLVRLRHPVDVVLLLVRPALLVERVEYLPGQLVVEPLLAPVARELHEPADGERARAARRDLDGNLVVGAADAARPHLEHRRHGLDRLLQHLDR